MLNSQLDEIDPLGQFLKRKAEQKEGIVQIWNYAVCRTFRPQKARKNSAKWQNSHFQGACNLSKKKKPVANVIRPSVFASVTLSGFLVAASKTDVTSKTKYIKIKTDGPLRYLWLYLNNR